MRNGMGKPREALTAFPSYWCGSHHRSTRTVKIDLDPGYGYAEFAYGDVTTKPIDLFASNDHYISLLQKHKDDTETDPLWAAWRAHLEGLGFPAGLSLGSLVFVKDKIVGLVADLRKKDLQPAS